jgi:hypothetical protein
VVWSIVGGCDCVALKSRCTPQAVQIFGFFFFFSSFLSFSFARGTEFHLKESPGKQLHGAGRKTFAAAWLVGQQS